MLTEQQIEKAKLQAKEELSAEEYKKEVERWKEKLKNKQSFLSKIFPFKILIIRRNK